MPGEVFVLSVKPKEFYWGRVIIADEPILWWDELSLAYVYDTPTTSKSPIPALDKVNLLIPPFGTTDLPWVQGYFETVAAIPLNPQDILDRHCFKRPALDEYRDERGNILTERIEPCGCFAIGNMLTLDDEISIALDIPIVNRE
jgi:hypothetical protein